VNFLTMVGKLVASTVCLRINKTGRGPIQLSGNHAAADHVRRVAVEDLVQLCSVWTTSQKGTDQLVRFRMKLPVSVQVCTG